MDFVEEVGALTELWVFTFLFAGIVLYRGQKIFFVEHITDRPANFWTLLIMIMLYATLVSVCLITFVDLTSEALGMTTNPFTAIVFVIGSAIVVDFINRTRDIIHDIFDKLLVEKTQFEEE